MDSNLLKGNLELILLGILEDGEMYGLEISKATNARTDGLFSVSVGSLYPALHKLEASGFVSSVERTPPRGGAKVRYYQMTEEGGKLLEAKRKLYRTFDGAMQKFLEK
ncbi:MAG: PadR family transcriptional regulator [Pseudopedobacter sp.]|nr:PadR family transcriptional regulator [Deinococcales bacterium]